MPEEYNFYFKKLIKNILISNQLNLKLESIFSH